MATFLKMIDNEGNRIEALREFNFILGIEETPLPGPVLGELWSTFKSCRAHGHKTAFPKLYES